VTADGRAAVRRAAFKLRPASAEIAPGSRARLVLKVPARAWKRAGRVRVRLAAHDAAGNVSRAERRVALRR
jgi:hypothetical protein